MSVATVRSPIEEPASPPAIGARVRAAREARGWTQQELAESVGMTQTGIASLETGFSARPRRLIEIAAVLGMSPAELIGVDTTTMSKYDPIGAPAADTGGEHQYAQPAGPAADTCQIGKYEQGRGPDADLLRLGERLAVSRGAALETLWDRMKAHRAATVEGLRAKARTALAIDEELGYVEGGHAMLAVVEDLLADGFGRPTFASVLNQEQEADEIRRAVAPACPAARLAWERKTLFDLADRLQREQYGKPEAPRAGQVNSALEALCEREKAVEAEASWTAPTSLDGAVFLLALAHFHCSGLTSDYRSLIRELVTDQQRHDALLKEAITLGEAVDRLIYAAVRAIEELTGVDTASICRQEYMPERLDTVVILRAEIDAMAGAEQAGVEALAQ